MNITFVFDGLQFGGIERIGVEYIKLLKAKGHKLCVVNLRPKLNDMEAELPEDVELFHVSYPRNGSHYRYAKLNRMSIGGKIAYGMISLLLKPYEELKRVSSRKQLNVCSTDIAIAFSGHVNDLTFVGNEMIPAKKKMCWLHGSEYSYNEISPGFFQLYNKIKNLICLSEQDDDLCIEFNKANSIHKWRVYNPINCADKIIDKDKVKKLNDDYGDYCLMIGRMAPDKDQKTVVNAIKYIKNKYGFSKKLIFVGDGPTRGQVEQLVRDNKLEEQIYFVGAQYDVQNYYSGANVFVHSSPAEGLPTVLLEAMYYGVPIACTDSKPGVGEIVSNTGCALVSEVNNEEQLGENIYKICADEDIRSELLMASRDRIKEFMPEHVTEQLNNILITIMNGGEGQ